MVIESDRAAPGAIDLLYADDAILVLNKPAGLLSVPGRGPDKQDCLSLRVQTRFADALVVHRLDMATSGLVVMARGAAMQRALSQAFADRKVQKQYLAIVQGALMSGAPGSWHTISLPIAVDWPNRPLRKIDAAGQPSETRYQVVDIAPDRQSTRVLLMPVTGRTHQLRLHLQAIGHPLWGDSLYAPTSVQALSPRLLLHASALAFAHPATGELLQFQVAPDF